MHVYIIILSRQDRRAPLVGSYIMHPYTVNLVCRESRSKLSRLFTDVDLFYCNAYVFSKEKSSKLFTITVIESCNASEKLYVIK